MARTDIPIHYEANRSPSIKSLMTYLRIDPETAKKAKDILTGKTNLMTVKASRMRQFDAYNTHETLTLALEALNEIIGTYGVEYVAHEDDGYRVGSLKGFDYLNTGDTYGMTLIYDHKDDVWRISSWGKYG